MKYLPASSSAKRHLGFLLVLVLSSFTTAFAQYEVVVAKDGTGNFATLQAAIDAAPANLATPYKILVKKGKYVEKVTIPTNKPFLHIFGEGVNETIFTWDDYAGKPGVTEIATITIFSNDCVFMNMTIENAWGRKYDGPQALAVRANGDRIIFKNCKFVSGQDTVMANGNGRKQYFTNCYFDGNTDYIYGSAIAVFDSCVIFNRDRVDGSTTSVFTAASTPAGQTYGYVFRNCLLPNNNGQTRYTLGRPWGNAAPPHTSETKVVFLNCRMGTTVLPARWQVWTPETNTALITYAEYKTRYFNGTLVDLSQRLSWTKAFSDAEAAPYFVNSNIFGSWDPCTILAEICQPFSAPITISNFRVNRSSSQSTFLFNICWPINGVTYQLQRSTDSLNFSPINSFTSITDTTVAYQFTDVLPPSGTSYFYKLVASKSGYQTNTADTILKVNISVPLNGEYRSANSGPWSNSVTAFTTLSAGAVGAVSITASPGGFTVPPTVTFSAAPLGGTTATGTAILTNGVVTGVNITNAGSGYTTAPSITWNYTGAGGSSVWQSYSSATASWAPVALGTSPSNVNTTIRSGHTVTLNVLASAGSLTIENGASLNSISNALAGATQTLRVGNGTAPVTASVTNNGLFGSTSGTQDGIVMEVAMGCKELTITGTGTTSIARFRPLAPNPNSLNVVIDQDMDFNMSNNIGFTGYYNTSTNTNTEVVTITVNAGKTVRITQPGGGFHTGTTTANPQGNITYNINGTLDLSATNSANMVPGSVNAASSVIMNIGVVGLLKTGTTFSMTNTAGSTYGTSRIVVAEGGVVDATKTSAMSAGSGANSGLIVLNGGLLKRAVGNTPVTYPVSATASSYNPVTISHTGTMDNYSVGLQVGFDHPVSSANRVVNRQWTINNDVAGGSTVTLGFGWTVADQAAGFDPAQAVSIIRFNGSAWEQFPATVTGSGTMASPYVATASGITGLGAFGIQNTQATLPLTLLSFNITANQATNSVDLTWTRTNESNTKEFVVERSSDNSAFKTVGAVAALNRVNQNEYRYTDGTPLKGLNYYRLKQVDIDGSYKYSNILLANFNWPGKIAVYPNPATDKVWISYPASNHAQINITRLDGAMMLSLPLPAYSTSREINIRNLASGSYLLIYEDGKGRETIRFSKQ
ncbi:T9SS type A sorting domain-containing protein [Segetibacter sp. 3557_3]|uniref:pectinesterase family protein n=1 Tax=Segetibacter sp. 3557_3 TaxID=2547429 RepID=UPI001058D5EE|nr:pectinesterase family protein [Segetibacter sp. 3557_3]TDH23959.1 T9SS type A sorting domain-containing protein [Segetibacter sp. 3557_3]